MAQFRTISVVFDSSNLAYSYFVPPGDNPQVGDLIITSFADCMGPTSIDVRRLGNKPVDAVSLPHYITSIKFARVVGVDAEPNPKATKYYVQSLSGTELMANAARRGKLNKSVIKRQEIRNKINALVAETDEMMKLRHYAAIDPRIAALLDEYNNLPE